VAVGHGQMDGEKLEDIMTGFMEYEYDVLVATTIIESGIDVPNANTIIINNAHTFGMSDLHQMRGRVGRSNKKAFCYLITPPMQHLPSDSRKRLEAVAHFSDLGIWISTLPCVIWTSAVQGIYWAVNNLVSSTTLDLKCIRKFWLKPFRSCVKMNSKICLKKIQTVEGKDFVADCIFETDLELLIPDTYVNQVNERFGFVSGIGQYQK
jgi:transcription-repair coupling factor (superfamily II helicase)